MRIRLVLTLLERPSILQSFQQPYRIKVFRRTFIEFLVIASRVRFPNQSRYHNRFEQKGEDGMAESETKRDRLRRLLIAPLADEGMRFKRGTPEDKQKHQLGRLVDDLAYMTDAGLMTLCDWMRSHADGAGRCFWPATVAVISTAESFEHGLLRNFRRCGGGLVQQRVRLRWRANGCWLNMSSSGNSSAGAVERQGSRGAAACGLGWQGGAHHGSDCAGAVALA